MDKEPKCSDCGMPLSSWCEYHPAMFCLLYRNGYHPAAAIAEAAQHLTSASTVTAAPVELAAYGASLPEIQDAND